MEQDTDVLDTWFSSALLPMSALGWPQQSIQHNKQFSLSLMETGHDIIFFWVARMVMLSLLLTGKLPFKQVLLHGMVCDANGGKMSKSKGNVVDPLDVINGISSNQLQKKFITFFESGFISKEQLESALKGLQQKFPKGIPECGADALRLTLLQLDFKESNVNFDIQHVIINKNFCNKMHNTIKFCLSAIDHRFEKKDIILVLIF